MYSKTCPIPVKNVRDKLIEKTPLSTLFSKKLKRHGNGGICLKKHEKLKN
jgi:hypothetical protein